MATVLEASGVKVLSEEGISREEMQKQLHVFLGKSHVIQSISMDDLARLRALEQSLKKETKVLETRKRRQ